MQRPKTQDERDLVLYESRLQRPVRMKSPEFERNGRIRHVIFSGQFTAPFLEELAGIADMIRMLSKSRAGQDFLINLLPHQAGDAVLYAAFDADVFVVLGRVPDFGHDVQRGARSEHVVGNEGRNAVRFDPHVQQLLRRDHHAEPDRAAGRVVCVFDERLGVERQPDACRL